MEQLIGFKVSDGSKKVLRSSFLGIPVNRTSAVFVITLPSVLREGVSTFRLKDINMMLKLTLAAIIASVSMISFAQDAAKPAVRAEVKADAKAARKAGDIAEGEKGMAVKAADGAPAARADVKAGAKMARKDGTIVEGEKGAPAAKGAKSTKTRAETKAEARKARKEGKIKEGEISK